jgi:hypothetical protein
MGTSELHPHFVVMLYRRRMCGKLDLNSVNVGMLATIVSLVKDLTIWKTFVNNEKVQEFMQSRDMNPRQLNGFIPFCCLPIYVFSHCEFGKRARWNYHLLGAHH